MKTLKNNFRLKYINFDDLRIKELIWQEEYRSGEQFSIKAFGPISSIIFTMDNIDGVLKYSDNIDGKFIEFSPVSIEEGMQLAQTRFEDFVMATFFEKDTYQMNIEQFMIELPNDLPKKYFHDEKIIKKMFFRYEHGVYEFMVIVDEKIMFDTDAYDDMYEDFYNREILYRARKVHTDFTLMEYSENLNIDMLKSDGYELVYDINEGIKIDSLNKILTDDNTEEFKEFVGDNMRTGISLENIDAKDFVGQTFYEICSDVYKGTKGL